MPLARDMRIGADARLCIWQITERTEDWAVPAFLDLSAVSSAARRCETLAVYALLDYMLGCNDLLIGHDKSGKPVLPGWEISVSHTKGWAALILSKTKRVAVDIEYMSDRVSRVADRFIRSDENSDGLHVQLVNWSAKETVYKFLHEENLQYFEMRLRPYCLDVQGRVEVEDLKNAKTVGVDYEINSDYVLTYAVGR